MDDLDRGTSNACNSGVSVRIQKIRRGVRTRESVMNQDDRVLINPTDFDESNPSGEDSSGQGNHVCNRDRLWRGNDSLLIDDDGVGELLVGITENLHPVNTSTAISTSFGPGKGGWVAATDR